MWTISRSADDTLFDLLDRYLTSSRIRFLLPAGAREVGRTAHPSGEPDLVIRVKDPDFARRVLTLGNLGLAECWMDEGFSFEVGTLDQLLVTLGQSELERKIRAEPRLLALIAAMRVRHAFTGARSNIELHYDVGNDVYQLFLDETMGYTCGYQKTPDDTLRQLQENKYERICQKIRLEEGDTLLDIGCGWGGLILYAAEKYGARARGITIAKNQAEFAMRRARALGLEDRVSVDYGDFREARGSYDKIVSVGMFEHLYAHEHPVYFRHIHGLLKDDGWGLVHFMGRITARNEPDPFTQKYIFPGSNHPRLSSVVAELEKREMGVLDVENIGRHYLPTARHWQANWEANKHRLDGARYDARFVRMYDYLMALYIAGSALQVAGLFQVLFTKDFRKNLPTYRV
jgi:cyclopropane-fatty-acyl-phospholipid synthase